MKPYDANPFHEIYVTDSIAADDFVRYFSPFLVPHLPELFREGNVVLKGTQGSGKSMLLKLFLPETRVAYANARRESGDIVEFPIPAELRNFVAAGVNLSKSGLMDIAQVLPPAPTVADLDEFIALFCDFLNYWLLRDLLISVHYITRHPEVFRSLIKAEAFEDFVEKLRGQDCWFGYLRRCKTFAQLYARVNARITAYRNWTARNVRTLDPRIVRTKTVIGEPLSRTVACMKTSGVIASRTLVFLRIDQIEELWHREGYQAEFAQGVRRVINRVVGNRDLRVSFRMGTRRYAWSGELAMPGGRQLEEGRDYLLADLDERLRRREDRSGWLFDGFAADVFDHRVLANVQETDIPLRATRLRLNTYFGPSPTPHELIEKLIVKPPEDPHKLLKLDDRWSSEWRGYISGVYNRETDRRIPKATREYPKNPLDALLTVAWGLQTGGISGAPERRSRMSPPQKFPPWTQWWEKERLMQAVMQLVVRHQQNLCWWGTNKLLALSASNITLFLRICREVWDQWLRLKDRARAGGRSVGIEWPVPWKTQSIAIQAVSDNAYRSFSKQPGRPAGDVRMAFVDALGAWLRTLMLKDVKMSYPGGNGFSLRESDLTSSPELKRLLQEAVAWGDLYEVQHTTKLTQEKHRDPRRKYYLNPILSPHFQVPEAHTKEPRYEPVQTIISLATRAKAIVPRRLKSSSSNPKWEV